MPSLTRTQSQLRVEISRAVHDYAGGTASGGITGTAGTTAGTLTTTDQDILSKPDNYYNGAELTHIITSSGATQVVTVGDFAVSGNVATFHLSATGAWTAPLNTDTFEVHHIGGRGYRKTDYDNAIYRAVEALANREWYDLDNISLA